MSIKMILLSILTLAASIPSQIQAADNTNKIIASCEDAYGEVYVERYFNPFLWDGVTQYKVAIVSRDAAQWFKSQGFLGSDDVNNPDVMIQSGMYAEVNNRWFAASSTRPVEGVVDADGSVVVSIENNYAVRLDTDKGEVTVSGFSFNNRVNVIPLQTKAADINWVFKSCQFSF